MKNTNNQQNDVAGNILIEVQQKTNAIKSYNDELEKQIRDFEDAEHKSSLVAKKSELSESLQIAEDSKTLDSIEKDFDKALIDIYADVADKTHGDF